MTQVIISYEDKRGASHQDYPHTADEALKRVQSLCRRHICATVTRDSQRIGGVVQTNDAAGGKLFWTWWLDWQAAHPDMM